MGASKNEFIREREAQGVEIPPEIEALFKATDDQINHIETLLNTSSYDSEMRARIEREMFSYSGEEAEAMITELYNNQLDPIRDGLNYNQTDINKTLDKLK